MFAPNIATPIAVPALSISDDEAAARHLCPKRIPSSRARSIRFASQEQASLAARALRPIWLRRHALRQLTEPMLRGISRAQRLTNERGGQRDPVAEAPRDPPAS